MTNDIDRISEALQFIDANDRETWLRMGMAIKSELADTGFDLWEAWSEQAESFNGKDARDVWKSIRAGGKVTIGTLFYEAKTNGWRDDGMRQKPTPEELVERRRIATERAAQEEAEIARERADTASRAAAILKAATEARADHPYLLRKRVSPVATLREIDARKATSILGYPPRSGGDLLTGRLLVVPVKQGSAISTVELIDENGRKAALAGRGSKAGGYWATERLPDGDGPEPLHFCEGVATTLSAQEATAEIGIATLSAGNMSVVAKVMRERYPTRPFVFCADLVKATGEPDTHAIEAAQSVGGKLAIPDFGNDRDPDMTDMNDLFILDGAEAVVQAIANASVPASGEHQPGENEAPAVDAACAASSPETSPGVGSEPTAQSDEERIERLAQLSPIEYDRVRESEAKAMGVRAATLDRMIRDRRKDRAETEGIDFDDVEMWPHPVDGAELLTELSATIKRFIICPEETAVAAALWIVMTWFMDVVLVAPLAVITAPEKRCGKSQLLFLLGRLVYRALAASNITAAALFRAVDAWKPTLLVDEADAFMKDNEELRGLLNCGHTRDSAYIVRVVGDDHTPKRFNVWGAKALAGIGHLADTIMDRAITLELRRKLPTEDVMRLRHAEPGLFDDLASKLARFAHDNRESLRRCRPDLPSALHDRAQDNWEPLLAIAEISKGRWPELARHAALKLSGLHEDGGTVGNELLADIREIFETKRVTRISIADLIAELCADDEKSWATYNRGKAITPRQVSKKLKDYGIASKPIRTGYEVSKGFERNQFDEAFVRYLAVSPVSSVTQLQPSVDAGSRVTEQESCNGYKTPPVTLEASNGKACNRVTDGKQKAPEMRVTQLPNGQVEVEL